MTKRISCVLFCLAILMSLSAPAFAAGEENAPAVTAAVTVDGVEMTNFHAALIDDTTYTSLYGATLALRPDAVITWEDDQMVCRAGDFTMSARVGSRYLAINDRYLFIPDGVKADEAGDTLVPTRTIAQALGAQIAWSGAVDFTSGGAPLESGADYYDADAVDLIARVITHESGNQPLEGKIAVGNVILNRVNSPSYPNTVYDVVYQPGQFPGATGYEPNAESVLAAKLCLDGAVTAPGALFFNGAGKDCWAARNKALVATIGGHAFYG